MAANTQSVSLSIPNDLAEKVAAFARKTNYELQLNESKSFYYVQFLRAAIEKEEEANGSLLGENS